MSVGLVFVSHSEKIAIGLVELARQMAGSTRMIAAGGTDAGGIGTSFEKVSSAIMLADGEAGGVVVLCDLGSAILTAETALDFLDDDLRDRVSIVDAPLVEGGVAAAVAAESGGDLAAVREAAESAASRVESASPVEPLASVGSAAPVEPVEPVASGSVTSRGAAALVELVEPVASEPVESAASGSVAASGGPAGISATTTLVNRDGLHARPAAEFVKLAARFDARVTVNGVDARSLLRIMSLGLTPGREVIVAAEGPDAQSAVTALVQLVDSGFGE